MSEYRLVVEFIRSHDDDDEIAVTNYPDDILEKALQKQFIAELQEGYELAGIAGYFEVKSIMVEKTEEGA